MMTVEFEIEVGGTKFKIQEQCESHAEFIEKVSFFSQLPQRGPNGEDDLKIVFRTTKEGYKYYSILSETAKKEFNLGQSQQKPGELFAKGWEDMYVADSQGQAVSGPVVGGGVVQNQQVQQQPVVQQPQVQQVQNQPVQQQPQVQQPVAQQVQQPVQNAQQPQQNQPQQNNQNQQIANNVLAQFGI